SSLHNCDFDPRPNCAAIGLDAFELQSKPMIAESRVLVKDVEGSVSIINAAHALEYVLGPIIVQVAEGDAMALLQMPEAARACDVLENRSAGVPEHTVRRKECQLRVSRAHVKVQPAIIVQVPEIDPHTPHQFMHPRLS